MGHPFRTADKIKFETGDLIETPVEAGYGAGHPPPHDLLQSSCGQREVSAKAAGGRSTVDTHMAHRIR